MNNTQGSHPGEGAMAEDLRDRGTLQALFPKANSREIGAIREQASILGQLRKYAVLSKESRAKILSAIRVEWTEEFERAKIEVSRSIVEKIQFVYKREGLRGLQLRSLLVPVGVAVLLLIYGYVPGVAMPVNEIAGNTMNSLHGAKVGNLPLIGGIVTIVAVGLLLFLYRNSKK